jgi:hypothetical protein
MFVCVCPPNFWNQIAEFHYNSSLPRASTSFFQPKMLMQIKDKQLFLLVELTGLFQRDHEQHQDRQINASSPLCIYFMQFAQIQNNQV